jgi:transposase
MVPAIEQMFGPESGVVRRLARRRRTVHRGQASAVTRLQGRLHEVEVAAAGAAGELLRLLSQRRGAIDDADLEVLEDLADRMGEARAAAWRGSQDLVRLRSRGA